MRHYIFNCVNSAITLLIKPFHDYIVGGFPVQEMEKRKGGIPVREIKRNEGY